MKKRRRKKSAWAIFFRPIKVIFTIFLVLAVICGIAGGVVLTKYHDEIVECRAKADTIVAQTKREDFSQPSDTRVYDADGSVIGTINSGHYEYVPISEISENLQKAYIAQEDRRFYEHHGVDFIGLVRAGVALVRNKGEITQGGSTITQQVIKNTYLTQEKSFTRKLTEIFAAPQMEKKYSKADILEFYCNTNFYGNRCYGVAEASRYYFDKEAKDLTVWEAALLTSLSNNPSRYDPTNHPESALTKRNKVIDNIVKSGFITEEEGEAAKTQPVTVKSVYLAATKENYQTSYAIHCASEELMKNEGFIFEYVFKDQEAYEAYKDRYQEAYQAKSDLIRNGGFEIHTSLDSNLQAMLQETLDNDLKDFEDLQENGKYALQGAAVCIDNGTGFVNAIVGGRGTEDEYNRGFLSRRQPGSTIKPLIDYAPAFESGYYYPSRLVNDHLFDKGPKNSGGRYYGELSVREALNRSLNTVAWQVLQDIGVDTGISYLGRMHFGGISYLDNGNTSMSIGGFTEGARIVDMAKGYSVLASDGMYSNNMCITGIVSQYEGEVFDSNQPDERIFTEDTAYMITDVLKGTLEKAYGTGYGLGISMPAAGKTGTTNSNKDTWFCGYTKYYTTAVWMGYDTPKAMPGVFGKTYAGKIWHDFMEKCNEGLPEADWSMPDTVAYYPVNSRGEKTAASTGNTDLFSSVAEAQARADSKKWEKAEQQKESQAAAERERQEALNASKQAVDQTAAQIQTVIDELNGLSYRDGTVAEKINSARTLLETIAGSEYYEQLKQSLDEAAARAESLSEGMETGSQGPQEIGPGVSQGAGPEVSPSVNQGEAPGSAPGNASGNASGNVSGDASGNVSGNIDENVPGEGIPDVQIIGPDGQ